MTTAWQHCGSRHVEGWRCNLPDGHAGQHAHVGLKGTTIASWVKDNEPAEHHWKKLPGGNIPVSADPIKQRRERKKILDRLKDSRAS